MKTTLRVVFVLLILLSGVMFIYGSMKVAEAESKPSGPTLNVDVPGVKVVDADDGKKGFGMAVVAGICRRRPCRASLASSLL